MRDRKAPGVGTIQNNEKDQETRIREAKEAFEALKLYYGDKFRLQYSKH